MLHVQPGEPIRAYLDIEGMVALARQVDVDAIHPGYGFLSENPHFAEICRSCKIEFIGPPQDAMRRLGNKNEARILANCYGNSLHLAVENEIDTIAFLAISCGAYGYPIEEAAQIALETTREFLAVNRGLTKVIFALWDEDVYEAFASALNR